VTVLFADVVHSMDIAAAVGPERLREIIADLADRCAAMVQRNGGTVARRTSRTRAPTLSAARSTC
jgi:adenylate cyclase